MDMSIDKEYVKSVIGRIVAGKEEKKLAPSYASMSDIMGAIREDALECMRNMCNDREIMVSRTLNSVAFKTL